MATLNEANIDRDTEANLPSLHVVVDKLSADERSAFMSIFIGGLSLYVAPETWARCLTSAQRVIANDRQAAS